MRLTLGATLPWIVQWLLLGCGSGTSALPPTALPALDAATAQRVQKLAPDLYARAVSVRELAALPQPSEAAREHAERASLLFEAAVLEADRLELEVKRDGLESARGRAAQARVAALFARDALERAHRHERQAMPPPGSRAYALQRTRSLIAAARALHAPVEALQVADNALLGAELSADAALEPAQRALASAERALGAARAQQPAPRPEEGASLVELGRERGLTVQPEPSGTRFDLRAALNPSGGALTAHGREQLAALRGLLRAHPHGAVQIRTLRPAGHKAIARALGPEFDARLAPAATNPAGSPSPAVQDAVLVLPAYTAVAPAPLD